MKFLLGGCAYRILFIILALVMLALFIKHNGPVM